MNSQYNILLYSDDIQFIQWFKMTLQSAMNNCRITGYELSTFDSVFSVTNYVYKNKRKFHLYFLDISEKNNLTMKLAAFLRDLGIEDSIVYLCNSFHSGITGYKVKILDYLVKPISPIALEQIVYYDYQHNFKTNYILLTKNSNHFQINTNNIVYVEVYKRGVKIYMAKLSELVLLSQQPDVKENINLEEKYIFYSEKISEFKKRLSAKNFVQCHQSFIINVKKIVSLRRYTAIVDNRTKEGKRVDVSKNNWNMLSEVFLKSRQEFDENAPLLEEELDMVSSGKISRLYPQLFPTIK